MKKKILLSSILATLVLSGCGSSGSNTESQTNTTNEVTVERGAILGATIIDSKGQIAKAVEINSNTYKFDSGIAYPVTVNFQDAVIDVNANSLIDSEDIKLNMELKSNSPKISFLSTLLFNEDKKVEEENIQKLLILLEEELELKLSKEELLDLPSNSKNNMIITNALYKLYKQNRETQASFLSDLLNKDASLLEDFKTEKSNLTTSFEASNPSDLKQKAQELEKQIVEDLSSSDLISKLSENEVTSLNDKIQKQGIYFNSKNLEANTYYFLSKDGNTYYSLEFTSTKVKLEKFTKENEKWNKDSFSSDLNYEVLNSNLNINTKAQEEKDFLEEAFSNKFIYSKNLITTKPEVLKDLDKEEVKTPVDTSKKDISYLLNKKFYHYDLGDGNIGSMFTKYQYGNTYASYIEGYVKDPISGEWIKQPNGGQSQIGKEQFIKVENNSVIFEFGTFKQTLKIKSFHADYILVNIHQVDSSINMNIQTDAKWHLSAPAWMPKNIR